ncbi:neutral zinc metallopeptidase [Planotetraspora sp. GP83]|uniref:neutral zinc metallopeptidase n=1 Tax=Planotetraspora sp. GP83 TaxID=3156264 RepID=UPI00351856F4
MCASVQGSGSIAVVAPRLIAPLTLVLAVVLVLTAACGRAGRQHSAGSPPGTASAGPCKDSGEDFAGDVRLARCLTEWFWTKRFAAGGATYQPIKSFVPYHGTDGPSCGGQPAVPDNAFYCPAGHFIAFDADWLESLYDNMGDGAVYVIIPHEFGHAVQAQLMNDFSFNVERELQADCYAGGTLSGLLQEGRIQADAGDDSELLTSLAAAGDPTDAWWAPDAHGSPQQRQGFFAKGFQQGVGAC